MNCHHCGRTVTAGAQQCSACGAIATAPADQPTLLGGTDSETRLVPDGSDATGFISPPNTSQSDAATRLHDRSIQSAEGPLSVGQAFGSRYHIIRLLGIGGMGAVYQAWDAELGVAVAIKVIRPEVMADPVVAAEISRRFKRELLLARQVTHKNVVRIHDLGDIGDIKYITMPYVDGADLASILAEHGRLPVDRTLRIARLLVDGLVAAHSAGVVHRDLKPANIMVDAEDEPLIMDFGIARSTGAPVGTRVPGNATIVAGVQQALQGLGGGTVLGSVIGTVEYMAPEQARGESVDQRADIYALGLILYDMLVGGSRAQRAGSAVGELRSRMEQPPTPVSAAVEGIPDAVERLIRRCLEPDPAKRYQTTVELADELAHIDENGQPVRVKRTVDNRVVAGAVTLFVAALAGTWWFAQGPAPPVKMDPVSVLISDFQNLSGDPTFDGTLEPMIKIALEEAEFVSAYDRAGIRRSLDVRPPEKLDDQSAREIAVKQGVHVMLSGVVKRQGSGYALSMSAMRAVPGTVIVSAEGTAARKDQVLATAAVLARTIRKGLGDNTSDDAQRFAGDTLSARSVEAVRDYADGMVAISNSKHEDARQLFAKAVERDPEFGMGWTALAMASFNLDKLQDTEKYVNEAMRHLDTMTERERYRTRGLFYLATSDYTQCVKEYGDLVTKFAADASAGNNLALCYSRLRKNAEAAEQMTRVVQILPNRALYRENLALYTAYAGEFEAAEREARALKEPSVFGLLAVAFAQLGQGQLAPAAETYREIGKLDAQGASYMASGLADIAVYEGRFSEAVRILQAAVKLDLAAKEPDLAASKLAALANTHLLLRQNARASAAAEQALANSKTPKIRFLAARILLDAGEGEKARAVAAGLASELQPEPRAYALILDGLQALESGQARESIKPLTEANALLDTWIGRFELGRAYFEAGALPQADSEFDRCIQRRGETLAMFMDEEPTYGQLPAVFYYKGRVREGLKTAGYIDSYRQYLEIRGNSKEDPLVSDARQRINRSQQ